ncbi:hypothetical protein CDL15_Pgr010093 [Punica granatum]|uniref:Uncharacterized protein n=1 Tax=Punica granatum TaxID=22663 RepID=A0A218X4G2_PUNGR|nr:hypothetical protein CDL15_Pgr010093 [Punica granatum]
MDPEAAKEQAIKQEFKRAEERLTLKHKNSSKWAKRILKRGLNAQDDGTRAAIAEQLQQHVLLTRKMNSMKENSSSGDSSDEDEEDSAASDQDSAAKLLANARDKRLKALEEENDAPTSGVLSLPFMVRGLKKRKEAAIEQAKLALEEYEMSSKQKEDSHEAEKSRPSTSSGRMVFGAVKPQIQNKKSKPERTLDDSDSEDDVEANEDDSQVHQNSIFKDPSAKTTYEVSIFASDSWRKMKDGKKEGTEVGHSSKKKQEVGEPAGVDKQLKSVELNELGEESDTESEGQMVDGVLSAGPARSYELPSQAELVRQAFAGDDVEEDLEKDKMEILNKENPEPEKPVLLPGWGQWTNVQKKRGLLSWMLKEHDDAKRKREEALKKRKDAHLKHVIISEKVDKKAEKLQTKSLPFPFTSKEVFEQSIRMPIGPEFNPVTALGALNRPEVVKKSGIIIKPIQFKEVNPHEKGDNYRGNEQKGGSKRKRGGDGAGKKKASKTRS